MVTGLVDMKYSGGVCQGFILGKNLEDKFKKGKEWIASSSFKLV